MKRLVVAIDCDDVLVETMPMVARLYNQAYGTSITLSDFYKKDPIPWGVDDINEASARFHAVLKSNHHELVPPQPTIDAITRLADNHELHLISGRSQDLKQHTIAMIEQYFKGCFTSIELTNMYDDNLRRSKGEVCKQLGADILIDDYLEHIESALGETDLKECIVYGQYPWNTGALPKGVIRCMSWHEVEKELERIAA